MAVNVLTARILTLLHVLTFYFVDSLNNRCNILADSSCSSPKTVFSYTDCHFYYL